MLARPALATMAGIRTRMRAERASLFLARLPTRVRLEIGVIFRILLFPTKTKIVWHLFVVVTLALDTLPAEHQLLLLARFVFFVRFADPLLDAAQVQGNTAR